MIVEWLLANKGYFRQGGREAIARLHAAGVSACYEDPVHGAVCHWPDGTLELLGTVDERHVVIGVIATDGTRNLRRPHRRDQADDQARYVTNWELIRVFAPGS